MPTTVYDASYITQKRRAQAVYTNAVTAGAAIQNGTSVRQFTAGNYSQEVIMQKNNGACACNSDYNPPNPCSCGAANNS